MASWAGLGWKLGSHADVQTGVWSVQGVLKETTEERGQQRCEPATAVTHLLAMLGCVGEARPIPWLEAALPWGGP